MVNLTRREVSIGAAALLAGYTPSFANVQRASLSWSVMSTGFTVLLAEYIRERELDVKNSLTFSQPTAYLSVPTLYSDFIAGAYDVCQMDWNSAATMYHRGVPLKFVCTTSTADMINIVHRKDSLKSVEDLRGKTVVAPQSTGAYRMMRALIIKRYGFDLESGAVVQNVSTGSSGINLVRAGRAIAAVTWEPHTSSSILDDGDLAVLTSAGQIYEDLFGSPLPYFGVAVRKSTLDRRGPVGALIGSMFKDAVDGINTDISGALQSLSGKGGVSREVLDLAFRSKRLRLHHESMTKEDARRRISQAVSFFRAQGVVPGEIDSAFFL